MAAAKQLRLTSSRALGRQGRLLTLESDADVGFKGGQFLIVDTGLRKDDGAPLKRCYSIMSSSKEQTTLELAVHRVGEGSEALQAFEPGAEVAYSGPWGKLLASKQPSTGPALVIATDTGITAALGLLCGVELAPRLAETTLLWLDHYPHALLERADVEARLSKRLGRFERREIPAVNDPARAEVAENALQELFDCGQPGPSSLWLVGDGAVLFSLRDRIAAAGGADAAGNASIECFFNNPDRKTS